MEYTFEGECQGSFEPTSDDLTDGLNSGFGDDPVACVAMIQE